MDNLNITERRNADITILDLAGKLRIGEGNIELRKAIRNLVESGEKRILLNLADITHVDSSGLGELVAGYVSLQKSQGELKLFNLNPRVYELMVMTKLLAIFDVYKSEPDAIESFQPLSEKARLKKPSIMAGKL
jgi:anti-sigma B factor antagonist